MSNTTKLRRIGTHEAETAANTRTGFWDHWAYMNDEYVLIPDGQRHAHPGETTHWSIYATGGTGERIHRTKLLAEARIWVANQ